MIPRLGAFDTESPHVRDGCLFNFGWRNICKIFTEIFLHLLFKWISLSEKNLSSYMKDDQDFFSVLWLETPCASLLFVLKKNRLHRLTFLSFFLSFKLIETELFEERAWSVKPSWMKSGTCFYRRRSFDGPLFTTQPSDPRNCLFIHKQICRLVQNLSMQTCMFSLGRD